LWRDFVSAKDFSAELWVTGRKKGQKKPGTEVPGIF